MSVSSERSTVDRLTRQIAELQKKLAGENKKVADAEKKIAAAIKSLARANSTSAASMYRNAAEREQGAAQRSRDAISKLSDEMARKTADLNRAQARLTAEEGKVRQKEASNQEKRMATSDRMLRETREQATKTNKALTSRISELEAQVSQLLESEAASTKPFKITAPQGESETYDVFLSHASEDKDDYVRDLVAIGKEAGLRIWYDEDEIAWGDSLRDRIDSGLRGSLFGVVVFSPAFFGKPWTDYELDGLLARALDGSGRLLPIWHRVTKDDVTAFSPPLAMKKALVTSLFSKDDIVAELIKLRDIYHQRTA